MRFGWSANKTSARIRSIAMISALLFIAIYAIIYWFEPFSELWNKILTDSFLVVASSSAAVIATLIWARYDQTDAPRHVWYFFAIGLWLWAVAELIWGVLNISQGEVPVGIPDVFWIISYFFLVQALVFQYRILAKPDKQELLRRALMAFFVLVAIYLLIYSVLTSGVEAVSKLEAVVNSFYPAADLFLALIAFWLASHFIGGAFSRPWLGLLAFAFADLMYAWVELSGLYSWSIGQANLLSTVTDIVYLGAYLILGLGLLSQWIFLKYGLRSPVEKR